MFYQITSKTESVGHPANHFRNVEIRIFHLSKKVWQNYLFSIIKGCVTRICCCKIFFNIFEMQLLKSILFSFFIKGFVNQYRLYLFQIFVLNWPKKFLISGGPLFFLSVCKNTIKFITEVFRKNLWLCFNRKKKENQERTCHPIPVLTITACQAFYFFLLIQTKVQLWRFSFQIKLRISYTSGIKGNSLIAFSL